MTVHSVHLIKPKSPTPLFNVSDKRATSIFTWRQAVPAYQDQYVDDMNRAEHRSGPGTKSWSYESG